LGKATRVIEYLADLEKTYIADVRFGATTDTYDREGFVTGVSDISALTCEQVASVLTEFRGPIEQVPPMHSALKRGGRPLYELARQGIVVEREPRQIIIYRLEMQDCQLPDVRLEVECSKGTYIRS